MLIAAIIISIIAAIISVIISVISIIIFWYILFLFRSQVKSINNIEKILKYSSRPVEQIKTDNLIKKLKEEGYRKKEIIWKIYHENNYSAMDPFDNPINRDNFTVSYILPKIHGGSNDIKNLIPLSLKSISEIKTVLEEIEISDPIKGIMNGKFFEIRIKKNIKDGIKTGMLFVDGKKVSK